MAKSVDYVKCNLKVLSFSIINNEKDEKLKKFPRLMQYENVAWKQIKPFKVVINNKLKLKFGLDNMSKKI